MTTTTAPVDWRAVPGYPVFYRPDVIEPGLRGLAEATGTVAAAQATASLDGGALVHGHSGAAMPAAAFAAPFLLDVLEHGHPAAKVGACGLLENALRYDPIDGYTRVGTSFGSAVPICCAVAHHVHARRESIVHLRPLVRDLLADASRHWSFRVDEVVDDGPDSIALGTLRGTFPVGPTEVECHTPDGHVVLGDAHLEYPVVPGEPDACLRLPGTAPDAVPARAALLPAECGRRVH